MVGIDSCDLKRQGRGELRFLNMQASKPGPRQVPQLDSDFNRARAPRTTYHRNVLDPRNDVRSYKNLMLLRPLYNDLKRTGAHMLCTQ